MSLRTVGEKLRHLRTRRALSIRGAAKQIGCTHVAWRSWERGQVPLKVMRDLIEQWSKGEIRADDWPQSSRTKEALRRFELAQEDASVPTGDEAA
jgi:transcriptional regulator with XRE-family HTH domain